MSKRILHFATSLILAKVLAVPAAQAAASDRYLVLGVITSTQNASGVALIKNTNTAKTYAVREGQEISVGITVQRVTWKYVYLLSDGEVRRLRVGEENSFQRALRSASDVTIAGDHVTVSASLKNHILENDLNNVLMQVATVPVYDGEALYGFKLDNMVPGSIYEKAGFKDGDIITALNGNPLSDVGRAVKILQSLRDVTEVQVDFMRDNREMSRHIVVN